MGLGPGDGDDSFVAGYVAYWGESGNPNYQPYVIFNYGFDSSSI